MSIPGLDEIHAFLPCRTPQRWIENALASPDLMLIDHAHCEKKAASTALSLMYRYVEDTELLERMSRLAREELRHFEQVLSIMKKRNIAYCHLTPSRYAAGLRKPVRTEEPGRLVDTLIVGGIIEARSCERFAALAPHLDDELSAFYTGLLKSEARHFRDYLHLAEKAAGGDVSERVERFLALDHELIQLPDSEFRFHSGPVPDAA
ncbi:tRNA-(ms[2]io[6]A)-hydroxylase [Tamilnaduibacter salinus]|uniref:tRNA-(Ms[2]io[6]A)-hydroxylase n=2 Tax=Tamilnaduibacter salinus TaxID=1484056 RepID=A0A2A2I680_9GAMM|nr:tRNA-(ms[2]io[6]A)-hydroxylase [Tamilnaduibacter salinus]PAV26784.1 tRNA-(ms[2]io[6]A)-hydroxylase [Tamilnaduibacter salinus]PVY75399.1 tRNA-(ms[2]io[6]A)-hydroxylase [Tamilnaduibacter salinus]